VNPKHLIALGTVGALFAAVATVLVFAFLVENEYRPPFRSDEAQTVPRDRALEELAAADVAADEEAGARLTKLGDVRSRAAKLVFAHLPLLVLSFVLAVPILATILEAAGVMSGDRGYDAVGRDLTRLLSIAFSATIAIGAIVAAMVWVMAPASGIFTPSLKICAVLFVVATLGVYLHHGTWGKLPAPVHLAMGLALSLVGVAIMFVANAWALIVTAPARISDAGSRIRMWDAITDPAWMPINLHRLLASLAFAGSVVAVYAAFRCLQSRSDDDRAHYDRMGYVGMLFAVTAFLGLCVASTWLAGGLEGTVHALGVTMMGGAFRWLSVIQAALTGLILVGANFYLWNGVARVEGERGGFGAGKTLAAIVAIGFAVWATPRSILSVTPEVPVTSLYPVLGHRGLWSAANLAVNALIVITLIGFLLRLRAGKKPAASRLGVASALQTLIIGAAAAFVLVVGLRGHFLEAPAWINDSVYMVVVVLGALVLATLVNLLLPQGAMLKRSPRWGEMPASSQVLLILLGVGFTWLMSLIGYVQSALRPHWSVYGIARDVYFLPTLGFVAGVAALTTLAFLVVMGFVFWLAGFGGRKAITAGS
jgi:hypothetical protein